MSNIPLMPAVQLRSVTEALETWGFPSEKIVESAGIPQWQYVDGSALVPGTHFYRLMDRASRTVGDESFATAAAGAIPIQSLGVLGRVLSLSSCLNDAVRGLTRVYRSRSNISRYSIVEREGEILWYRRTLEDMGASGWQVGLYALAHQISIVRLFAGRDWRPRQVWLEGRWPPNLQRLELFANADMHAERGITGITIPCTLLPLPPRKRVRAARARGGSAPPSEAMPSEFLGSLRRVSRSLLFFGHPKIDVVAEIAGMSPRTLQRRLREEGVTFKQLVDQARFGAARDLLRRPELKLVEVAQELGYADQAHFNRAFRRWAGVTPSAYRLLQHSQ